MTDTFNPTTEVRTQSGPVTVRELAWPEAMRFFRLLADNITPLMDDSGEFIELSVERLKAAIPALVASTEELSRFLLIHCTGKDEAWLDGLRTVDALAILDAAIELNITPELIDRGKQLAGRVAGAFGLNIETEPETPKSPEPSTSSSPKVTPSPKSTE